MLGSDKTIKKVVIYPTNGAKYFPKGLKIEVSEDGKTFKQVFNYTENENSMEPRTFTFEPVNAVFLRITTTEMRKDNASPDGYLFQVAEVEIY